MYVCVYVCVYNNYVYMYECMFVKFYRQEKSNKINHRDIILFEN